MTLETDSSSKADSIDANRSRLSRYYSEDLTACWNRSIYAGTEPIEDRFERYMQYTNYNDDQLRAIQSIFLQELEAGLISHKSGDGSVSSMPMLDTCVSKVPTGMEKGVFYSIEFGGTHHRVLRVELLGNGKCETYFKSINLNETLDNKYPNGLLDKDMSATDLFDYFAKLMKEMLKEHNDDKQKSSIGIGFTFSFQIHQKHIQSGELISWAKGFETGRNTCDPVEGVDVVQLLQHAFQRHGVNCHVSCLLNDTTATLLSCAYELAGSSPPCMAGLVIGSGINGCYLEPEAKHYGYTGTIINTEFGNFNMGLPRNDVDAEVNFAHESNRGMQSFEKMISGKYIGELARRLIVKVFEHSAPEMGWIRGSLPADIAINIVKDEDPMRPITKQIMATLWDWKIEEQEHVDMVYQLILSAYDRSAALAAVSISAFCIRTHKLQKALGGVAVGIDGALYRQNEWYKKRINIHLDKLLGKEKTQLIKIVTCYDGAGKGAAILACMLNSKE